MFEWPQTSGAWVAFILGGILLAVVGNAAWEYLFRPPLGKLGGAISKLAVHGTGRFATGLVRDAARRVDAAGSLGLQVCSIIGIVAFSVSLSGLTPPMFQYGIPGEIRHEMAAIESAAKTASDPRALDALHDRVRLVKSKMEVYGSRLRTAMMVLTLLAGGSLAIAAARGLIVRYLVNSFDWWYEMLRPYLSTEEAQALRSDWARMRTPDDIRSVWDRVRVFGERMPPRSKSAPGEA